VAVAGAGGRAAAGGPVSRREETTNLYPGLVVHDGRVSGSITSGRSRLPLWALPLRLDDADADAYDLGDLKAHHGGADADDVGRFLHHLLEHRRDWARLLLALAAADRGQAHTGRDWRSMPTHRRRVARLLRRLLAELEAWEAADERTRRREAARRARQRERDTDDAPL
jgi:hypothetical protein